MPAQPPPPWSLDDDAHADAERGPRHRPVRLGGGAVLASVAVLTLLASVVGGAVLVSRSGAGDDAARLASAAGRTTSQAPADLADGPQSPGTDAAATTTPATTSSAPAARSKAPARKGTRTSTPARPRPATTKRTTTRTTRATTRSTRPTTRTTTRTRTTTSSVAPGGSLARQVLALTNDERAKAGCKPLSWDATLAKVAQAHSEDMAANGYFAHESQDGRSPFDRMKAAGYAFRTAAENIAAGQQTPASVMGSWMNSSGHRANILNCSLTELGVGVAKGGPYGIYWTQDFGTPA